MGAGQQQRRHQGPPSSAGNPGQQQTNPSVSQSIAGGQQTQPSGIPQVDGPNEPRQHQFGRGLGFDPARDPKQDETRKLRCELPSYRENVSNIFALSICLAMVFFTIYVEVVAASRKYAKQLCVVMRVICGWIPALYSFLNLMISTSLFPLAAEVNRLLYLSINFHFSLLYPSLSRHPPTSCPLRKRSWLLR